MFIDLRERETSIDCLQHAPQPDMEPAAWVGILTGIEPPTFWCTGRHSNQMSHTGQGCTVTLLIKELDHLRIRDL